MSHEVGVAWKIKVKRVVGKVEREVEVVGMNYERVKAWFDELEKKFLE